MRGTPVHPGPVTPTEDVSVTLPRSAWIGILAFLAKRPVHETRTEAVERKRHSLLLASAIVSSTLNAARQLTLSDSQPPLPGTDS